MKHARMLVVGCCTAGIPLYEARKARELCLLYNLSAYENIDGMFGQHLPIAAGTRCPETLSPRKGIGVDGRFRRNRQLDRKSTRLNSSHVKISYAVFCLKKKIRNSNR